MRRYSWVVIAAIFTIIVGIGCFSDMNDYARITEVDYTAVVVDEVGSNGKVIITERLTFDIHAESIGNPFWELWRDLPEAYVDGVKVDYKVNYVKQILDDGSSVIYDESPKLYWDDFDYINTWGGYGPGKWYHSKGPYDGEYKFECVLFYVDALYRETVVYEIQYEMNNAALRYGDSSELYLAMYSGETTKYLNSFKGQILFPNETMPRVGNYDAYTYGTNSHEFDFIESDTANPGYHTFSFDLDESQLQFRAYNEYIEFALISFGEDKHKFTNYASVNDYYNDNMLTKTRNAQSSYENLPETFKIVKIFVFIVLNIITLFILYRTFTKKKRVNKKYTFYKPEEEMLYYRDIPSDLDPNFAAALVFCKHKSKEKIEDGYAAIMLSLAHKGYIELDKIKNERSWDSNNVKIVVKFNPTSQDLNSENLAPAIKPLTTTEEQYFNLIVRHSHGVEISMNSFQEKISMDYQNTDSFVKSVNGLVTRIGVTKKYFQNNNYRKPKEELRSQAIIYAILGTLIIIFGNSISFATRLDLAFGSIFVFGFGLIISALYLYKISKKAILLTQFGENEYAKWRALYNFLNSETLMKEKTVIELALWEQYLIYATAFGISEKVIKALEVRCPDRSSSPILYNPYYRSRSFYTSRHAFRTATRTASFTVRSGGHGGFGGGGRGGGGGGGGH